MFVNNRSKVAGAKILCSAINLIVFPNYLIVIMFVKQVVTFGKKSSAFVYFVLLSQNGIRLRGFARSGAQRSMKYSDDSQFELIYILKNVP